MKDKILKTVSDCLLNLNSSLNSAELEKPTFETRLYGSNSVLDSITLVTLIADIEDRISMEFGKDIILADERAMSQTRSPFGQVGTLVDYIEQLLENDK